MNILKLNIQGKVVCLGVVPSWNFNTNIFDGSKSNVKCDNNMYLQWENAGILETYLVKQGKDFATLEKIQPNLLKFTVENNDLVYENEIYHKIQHCEFFALNEDGSIMYPFGIYRLTPLSVSYKPIAIDYSLPAQFIYLEEIMWDKSLPQKIADYEQVDVKMIKSLIKFETYVLNNYHTIVDLHRYVKYVQNNPDYLHHTSQLKNIFHLYNSGFIDSELELFENIFKSYSTQSINRYEKIYKICQQNVSTPYSHIQILRLIQNNVAVTTPKTLCGLFQKIDYLLGNNMPQSKIFNIMNSSGLTDKVWGDIVSVYAQKNKVKFLQSFQQYPHITVNSCEVTRITNFNDLSKKYQKCLSYNSFRRAPQKDEIVFVYSFSDDLYVVFNLINQKISYYGDDGSLKYMGTLGETDYNTMPVSVRNAVKQIELVIIEQVLPKYFNEKFNNAFSCS